MPTQRREEKRVGEGASVRERETAHFRSSFYMFFLPMGLPYVNWASQECCLFYLRSSLRSSDLPLTFLYSIFVNFSLPCLLATAILDSFFLFYLPNVMAPHSSTLAWKIPWMEEPGGLQSMGSLRVGHD